MKILYALPATGNVHISRAAAIYPYLKKYGAVDFLISGSNSQLNYSFPVKYKFKGLSLYYDCSGGLSLRNIFQKNSFRNFWKDAKSLDLSQYDMVISDYEPISALACKLKKQPFLHWGHQASFVYEEVPRPKGKIYPGKWILENLVYSPLSYGIHFKSFHSNISTSIIKDEIFYAPRLEENLVTVYLQ